MHLWCVNTSAGRVNTLDIILNIALLLKNSCGRLSFYPIMPAHVHFCIFKNSRINGIWRCGAALRSRFLQEMQMRFQSFGQGSECIYEFRRVIIYSSIESSSHLWHDYRVNLCRDSSSWVSGVCPLCVLVCYSDTYISAQLHRVWLVRKCMSKSNICLLCYANSTALEISLTSGDIVNKRKGTGIRDLFTVYWRMLVYE